MATAPILPTVTMAVGQQVEFSLTVVDAGSSAVWISCDHPTVVAPATAGGIPLTWPCEVLLAGGAATFGLLGISPGTATLSFVDEIDPPDPDTAEVFLGSIEVNVIDTGEEEPIVEVDVIVESSNPEEPMGIAEPIIIVLIPVQPAGPPF